VKEIEIIPIAMRKMRRRGIPDVWVTEALNRPDQIVEGYEGRQVAHRRHRVSDKEVLLRVVFEESTTKYTVITAYLTSDVKRYWKEER